MMIQASGLTIGADQGMSYSRVYRQSAWTDDLIATIDAQAGGYVVNQGLIADGFSFSGGVYTSTEGNGATLSLSGQIWTYTAADGTVIHFNKSYANTAPISAGSQGQVTDITRPDGTKYTFSYNTATYCPGIIVPGSGCNVPEKQVSKLKSVDSSYGYRVTFTHAAAFPGAFGQHLANWFLVTGASVSNLAGAIGTALASNSYASTATTRTITDAMSRVYQYTMSGSDLTGIRLPGSAADDITIGYTSGRVTSVSTAAGTTNYSASDAAGIRTVTVTDPLTHATTYKFNIASKRLTELTNANGKTTAMQYDPTGRLTRTTMPEGNYLQLTYDARGNVTERRAVSKAPGTPADIVTLANFPATCTNPKTCNQPIWTRDARNNQTDYTYDAGHGGVLTVTAPAPAVGAVRPQTRYTYSSLQAYYRNSGGSIVASGIPVLRLTGVSACQTTASCTGAADEVKSTVSYGPQVTGTGNNLLPVSTSSGAGDISLTATMAYTYDELGNLTLVDGPLSGTADTTRNIYNAARQPVGTISPDPDGAGALKNRARRITIDNRGLVTKVENGTTNGQTDPAWAAFAPAEAIDIGYDAVRRPTSRTLSSGGTNYALTQTSYLADHRVDCVATRMNPAIYGSLPASACTLGTAGSFGPDRIAKSIYDNAGQVTQHRVAVGVIGEEAAEATFTYTNNGKVQTLKDAENNLTTYFYDGHDRLSQTQYPNTPKGSGTSNPNDFEQLSYDAASNVTGRQLRGTPVTSIAFTYNSLNRPTLKDLPGSEPDVTYAYDNLGRLTSAAQTGNSLSFSYDALSRQLSESGPLGIVTQQFDLTGRRTGFSTSAGFCLLYQHLVTGEMSAMLDCNPSPITLAAFAYDDLGRRTGLSRIYGTSSSWGYDPVSRLSSLTHNFAGTANDVSWTFAHNPAGQIVSSTRDNDAYAWTGHGSGSTASSANGLNQLASIGGGTPTFDARGNMTSDSTTGKTFAYSSENMLTSASGGTTLSYDPLGRLYQSSDGATIRRYQYAIGESGIDEAVSEYDGAGSVRSFHGFGPGVDELMFWWDIGGGHVRPLHADERGSIVALSDWGGNPIAINRYDEFGKPAAGNIGRFQYTGQMWMPEVGLYYYKNRAYAPHLGRFMQTDPIGYAAGMNLYAYVGNDPVNWTDPLGLDGQDNCAAGETWMTPTGSHVAQCIDLSGGGTAGHLNPSSSLPLGGLGLGGGGLSRGYYAVMPGSVSVSGGDIVVVATTSDWVAGVGSNWTSHNYPIGPYFICRDTLVCRNAIRAVFPTYVVPNLGSPVTHGQISPVYATPDGIRVGSVQTFFSPDGLSATNVTMQGHWLCCGQVDISNRLIGSSWYVSAHGYGTNYPGVGMFNQWYGPEVFQGMLGDYIMVVRSRLGQ